MMDLQLDWISFYIRGPHVAIFAILVDWHNLYRACESAGLRLEAVIGEIVRMGLANGNVQQIRLFVPPYQIAVPWRVLNALQLKYDLAIEVCPVMSQMALSSGAEVTTEMKDAVDFKVLQWVETHLHNGVGPDSVTFVTGDGHFLMSANVARRKGKKVEFWNIAGGNVHQLIRRQEDFREIKLSPPIILTKENSFLDVLNRLVNQQPLSDEDQRKLGLVAKMAQCADTRNPEVELSAQLSSALEIPQEEAQELLEALMTLDIARVYPAVRSVIDLDTSSPLFQSFLPRGRSQ